MREEEQYLPQANWALQVQLDPAAPQGLLLQIQAGQENVLAIRKNECEISICLRTVLKDHPRFPSQTSAVFELSAPPQCGSFRLEWLGYSFKLFSDTALLDEEWPLGSLPQGKWTLSCAQGVHFSHAKPCTQTDGDEMLAGAMQFFSWPWANTGVGDCMPFERDGRYCLYHLFDRRGHKSKNGLGAHQWAQISSPDLIHWTLHPIAVPITQQWEGSICTGSLVKQGALTHAFYAVRMSDGSPAKLTSATSADGVHFEKTARYFTLTAPFEPVSARDPMVFQDAQGLYHMLVTTSLVEQGRYGGCLAHLTSADLQVWAQQPEPFLVPGYADQPECSDYFEWNGWYYLLFSNFATTRYRMSKHPFGPWIKPASDIVDAIENQVAKTAAFGKRRLLSGFLARYPRTYAGNAITHELYQREDGTLGARFVPEILPKPSAAPFSIHPLQLQSPEGRLAEPLKRNIPSFRLRAQLCASGSGVHYGFTFAADDGEYRIDFHPADHMLSVLRPGQEFQMGEVRNQLTGISFHEPFQIDWIVYGDMLDIALSNGRTLCMRLSHAPKALELSAFVQNGAFELSHILLEPLA